MKKLLTLPLLFIFLFSFLSTYSQVSIGGYTANSPYYATKYSAGSGTSNHWVNVGHEAGYQGSGSYFVNVGAYAGDYASNMYFNTHVGYGAGYKGSYAQYNTAIGAYTLYSGTGTYLSGDSNTAVGYQSSYDVTTGYNNTSVGMRTLYNLTSGYYNTAVGTNAGDSLLTGYYNSYLGTGTEASSTSAINQTMIGYGADGQANNSVTLGNSDVTAVYMAEDSGATVYAAGLNLGSTAVTSTAAELNILDGVTATASEINIIDGVTATTTEINYVDGVTSNVQTQLDSKQATITGAATTIDDTDLTASRALVSNGSGKVEVSAVTSTELGYLDGVTSAVQTQLDSKLSSSGNITVGGNVIIPDAGTIGSTSDTDAMTIAANGNTTFSQDITVSGDVTISSDARLKSNIVSLGSTLSKLLLIDGKSYIMNKSGKEKIGILAQEVQEVFPELVSKDANEMLSVNYQGLVPVLINAIKEQEDKISRLEKLVEQLISKN